MASPIDICNLALSRLGDKATVSSIDPPEGSAQAVNCAAFYPIARDIALEARRWGFNTQRDTTPAMMDNPQPGWAYAYAIPDDCLKVIAVIPPAYASTWWLYTANSFPFTREIEELTGQEVILTNVVGATVIYQKRIDDTLRFPPQFVSALAWLLSSYLAGPIIKGDAGRKAAQNATAMFESEIAKAGSLDANQTRTRARRVPDSIAARGGYCPPVPDAPLLGEFGAYGYPDTAGFTAYPDALGSN